MRRHGDLARAREIAAEALDVSRASGSAEALAGALNTMAGILHTEGDYAGSLEHTFEHLKLRQAIGDRVGEVKCLNNLGLIYTALGDYPQALEFLTGAHRIVQESALEPRIELPCLANIGLLYENINDLDQALAYYQRALDLSRDSEDRASEALCRLNASNVLQRLGRLDEALENLEEALVLARETEVRLPEMHAHYCIGQAREAQGDLEGAFAALNEALRLATESGDLERQVSSLLALGGLHLRRRDFPTALETLQHALELAADAGMKREVFEVHEKLADAYRLAGDPASALEHYVEFHRLEREIFNEESERKTRVLAIQFEVEKSQREAEFYRLRIELESRAREQAESEVRERTRELEAAQIEVVTRLALAAEYRDDQTGDHTWRVGWYSALLGRELGLSSDDVDLLRLAARLHDVGKIGTPDAILLKPGKLTLAEYRTMESHAAIGARILSGGQSRLLRVAEEIALTHHERWDGRGYPRGLCGEEIPLLGRVVAVADVFDALTSERPYKRAWAPQEAMEEIERQAGRQFDPRVVEAARRVLTPQSLSEAALALSSGPGRTTAVHDLEVHWAGAAYIDPLTGLGNAAAFESDLENELLRAARRGYGVRVLSVRISAPDSDQAAEVERALALALRAQLRGAGRAYRVEDGAYAAIITSDGGDLDLEAAVAAALAAVAAEGLDCGRPAVEVTAYPPAAQGGSA